MYFSMQKTCGFYPIFTYLLTPQQIKKRKPMRIKSEFACDNSGIIRSTRRKPASFRRSPIKKPAYKDGFPLRIIALPSNHPGNRIFQIPFHLPRPVPSFSMKIQSPPLSLPLPYHNVKINPPHIVPMFAQ